MDLAYWGDGEERKVGKEEKGDPIRSGRGVLVKFGHTAIVSCGVRVAPIRHPY